ncbi:hypothetical protein tb265_11630 [Gemmatimonadetes bacterium T265]|nr:hypothetical protein tb265_11630 [Gemmatimonadetes bacterium T265]
MGGQGSAASTDSVAPADVRVDMGEADAVLAVLAARRAGRPVPDRLWAALAATAGYRRLAAREHAMRRAFSDSAFRAFLHSDALLARDSALAAAVARWRTRDVTAPARRALAYLPPGTRLRATLYPVIKPAPNSFVFDLAHDPAFFVSVDPAVPAATLENTLAHELHHVGYAAACGPADAARDSTLARRMRRGGVDSVAAARLGDALEWTSAFGEGLAMLAAAGGAGVHPHAASPDSDRARWDRDVANVPTDLPTLDRFFTAILDGRFADGAPATPDAVRQAGMAFFGVQGPWYTVGYVMARTIEETYGRRRLLAVLCDPPALMATYNRAVRAAWAAHRPGRTPDPAGGRMPTPLPRWRDETLTRLAAR